jgi:hypothetical protein
MKVIPCNTLSLFDIMSEITFAVISLSLENAV